ncbi:MAG: MG2 domain-containing protein, partial [candidate division KSB1 bacterium]|nr:MG2 domain-containing protein [candidate division KSB1 bacterium]
MKKILIALSIGLLLSCGKEQSSVRGKASAALNSHPLVEAYTSGFVGRTSTIRVVFVTDLVDSSRVNTLIQPSPFTFSPKLSGEAYWADRRTIEFRPRGRLAAGVTYQAEFDPRRLSEVDLGDAVFSFRFSTIVPAMEVHPEGFIIEGDRLQFEGRVSLSEIADIDDPLSLLKARLGNKELPLQREGEDRRAFRFRVTDIQRAEKPMTLFISWDGKTAGIEGRGALEIPVPAKSAFELLSARAVQEEGEFIELRFSQALQSRNFTGLVQVDGSDNLRFSADRNVLRIYGEEPFAVGEHIVTIHPAFTSAEGKRLERKTMRTVAFAERKPSVRFLGKGVILPTTQGATLPIEAVNLSSILVTAVRIPTENVPQFLQVNDLGGEQELRRVGREVWKRRVDLTTPEDAGSRRYGLDLTPLIKNAPTGLYRLTLSFRRPQIIYPCAEGAKYEKLDESLADWDDEERWEYEGFGDFDWSEFYARRFDPCHPAYYYPFWDHNVTVSQNVLISDIGLTAKMGTDTLWVAAADLKSTAPLGGVKLTVLNYQRGVIASGSTDGDGLARIPCPRKPFLLVGEYKGQFSYLKLNDGSVLSLSRFDVGGERPVKGMRGFLYTERGVRRPGDPIYVTLILWPDGRPPEEHPAVLELIDPRGRTVASAAQKSVDGFYSFKLATSPDAPTGNWTARCTVGGAVFHKTLKIETVMPNRLEAQLDFGDREALNFEPTSLRLSARWLFGAKASGLKAKVELRLTPQPTRFSAFPSYTFDNPAA